MRWKTLELLGQGGFGTVFHAQLDDGQHRAIKRLSSPSSKSQLSSLRLEGEIASALVHPNIVRLFDVCADDQGHACLIMELVRGVDLGALIDVARLPIAAAVYVARSVLQALVHAHESARIVHRDISPENVLVSWEGDVKVADFGIAKSLDRLSRTSDKRRGKVSFMSPEQYLGDGVDVRADLFALGVVLYELLAGYSPYQTSPDQDPDDTALGFMVGHVTLPPLAERCPELPPAICDAVMRLIEHDRANRYESAREVLDALPDWPHGKAELIASVRNARNLGAFETATPEHETATPEHEAATPEHETATPAPRPRSRRWLVALLAYSIGVVSTSGVWMVRDTASSVVDESPGHDPAPPRSGEPGSLPATVEDPARLSESATGGSRDATSPQKQPGSSQQDSPGDVDFTTYETGTTWP